MNCSIVLVIKILLSYAAVRRHDKGFICKMGANEKMTKCIWCFKGPEKSTQTVSLTNFILRALKFKFDW